MALCVVGVTGMAILVGFTLAASGTGSASATTAAPADQAAANETAAPYGVPAVREPLTTNQASPVVHDTETDALVGHDGRLFATTDQWEYPGPSPSGQILVKDSPRSPWKTFEQTQGLRVSEALDSFPIPKDQGLGPGHSLLITHAVVDGRSQIQWLIDGATSFSPKDSFPVPANVNVRSFGAHETGGVWAVYAGVVPTGILRGTWSKTRHTLVFDPTPELTEQRGAPGVPTQKVTGFANLRRLPLRDHQHQAVSPQRRRPSIGSQSLGTALPGAGGGKVQQWAPGSDLHHPPWVPVPAALHRRKW